MFQRSLVAFCGLGLAFAGCTMPVESEGAHVAGIHPDDVKPEDGSESLDAEIGTSQQAHALHYTDGTNLWKETEPAYPMGTDNPNCKDWNVYDRYLSNRPPLGTTKYTTIGRSYNAYDGPEIDAMMNLLPSQLGYTTAIKNALKTDHTVVARSSGNCTGRYVFQFNNRTNGGPFERTSYWVSANIPDGMYPQNKEACKSKAAESVPHMLMDMYVCEAKKSSDVTPSVSSYCSKANKKWRKVGSYSGTGIWSDYLKECFEGGGVYYQAPADRVAVSFNVVIKTGVGHGVAPADIYVLRY